MLVKETSPKLIYFVPLNSMSDQQSHEATQPEAAAEPSTIQQNNTARDSNAHAPHHNTVMGILAYMGPLVLVPYLTAKEDPFVKFHIKQVLVLLAIIVILWTFSWWASMIIFFLFPILQIINIGIIILSIVGIVHVVRGEQKELPLVGQFAIYFKI